VGLRFEIIVIILLCLSYLKNYFFSTLLIHRVQISKTWITSHAGIIAEMDPAALVQAIVIVEKVIKMLAPSMISVSLQEQKPCRRILSPLLQMIFLLLALQKRFSL
jgi:hypothetical protein